MARSFFSRKQARPSATTGGKADSPAQPNAKDLPESESEITTEEAPEPENQDAPNQESEDTDPAEVSAEEAESPEPATAEDEERTLDAVIDDWAQDVVELLREDATKFVSQRVRLEDIHPGGIAQLYVDRVTRLDTLVREHTALGEVSSKTNTLINSARTQSELHGRADVHLAIGTATWKGLGGNEVPVLMRRVDLQTEEDGAITLQLLPGVEVNTRLLKALERAGAKVDIEDLSELMRGPEGFIPGTAFDRLRVAGESLEDFELREEHVLGMYSHPAGGLYRQLRDSDTLAESPVVRALAGDEEAREDISAPEIFPNPFDRDPWRELGLGDQTPQVLDTVEAVAEGGSLVANVRGRENAARTTASFAAAIAHSGRSALIITNDSRFRADLMQVFDAENVSEIVANFATHQHDQDIAQRLLDQALSEDLVESDASVEDFRTELKRAREALSGYTEALHQPFEPWNVSAFQALQVLTDLTSMPNAPSTQVRLPKAVLSQISSDGGEDTRELLDRASFLGLFTKRESSSPWQGVTIEDAEEIGPILGALGRLTGELIPAMRMQMSTTAARCDLRQASTLSLWRQQLELLGRVRDALDVFKLEALERSPADMVVATASKQWRKSKNINLKRSHRRDLVKQARDMVRPGVHVEDLHEALVEAQAVRLEWGKQSDSDSWPTVPDSIDELESTWEETRGELDVLRPYLEPVYGDLDAIYIEELASILEQLYQDPEGAKEVPELGEIRSELRERGLESLVQDFQARGVDGENMSLELDLAWWASTLGIMLRAEPRLGGFDPEGLQEFLARTQKLDELQVESLGPELVRLVKGRAWETLGMFPQQRNELIAAMKEGVNPQDSFATSNLPWDLMPIVVAAPAQAAALVQPGRSVDAVIVAGFKDLPAAGLIPILSRAKQVVVVEDVRPSIRSATKDLFADVLPVVEVQPERMPTGQLASRILTSLGLRGSHVAVPTPVPSGKVSFIQVEGTGMPAPGAHGIESSRAEVDAVVELILDHLRETDGQTLAVVTFSERHADRIRQSLSRAVQGDAELVDALEAAGGASDIVVFPADLAANGADSVVVSIGFAKTPHGRVIHDFGVLSTPDGAKWMEDLALGVGDEVTVVSSLTANDIDPTRLHHLGEEVLLDLLELAGELSSMGGPESWISDVEPEQLLTDLAERLHRLGLEVHPNLGIDGGMRIPLAIGHPEVPGELLVAIMTDNEPYMSEHSQRVRNRHWTRLLEKLGWKVRTVLSMSVFIDPNREAERIVDLTLDAVDEYYARIGVPATPAAAAALGVAPIGAPDEDFATVAQTDAEIEVEAPAEPAYDETQAATAEDPIDGDDPTSESVEVGAGEEVDAEVPGTLGDQEVPGIIDVADVDIVTVGDSEALQKEELSAGPHGEDSPGTAGLEIEPRRGKERGPQPEFSKGLPLAAYSDDQLDELAVWVRTDGIDRSEEEVADELRDLLGISRRGAQTDAVLRNVARRTEGK